MITKKNVTVVIENSEIKAMVAKVGKDAKIISAVVGYALPDAGKQTDIGTCFLTMQLEVIEQVK